MPSDFARDMIAGSVAGSTTTLIMAPLDTLRTRLQAGKFATAREALVGTLRHEGFLALYKGMSMPLAAQAVYKAVLFSGFGFSSRMLASVEARLPVLTWFACGSFAGLCNSICVCPVELIRNRLQVQHGSGGPGALGMARSIARSEGARGLWRGWTVTAVRDGVGVGAWFAAFSFAKARLLNAHVPETAAVALAGCCAGASFWTVALPVDCVKTLVQTADKRLSAVVALRQLDFSPRRLYRGYPIALMRGLPAASLTFSVQHHVAKALDASAYY